MLEQVVISGDLSRLKSEERVFYYKQVCESLGLNPLTKPFEYITLNNKLTLYALRSATEQLRKIHGVSVLEMTCQTIGDVYVVKAKFMDKDGRTDHATGAVPIKGLTGEALANAYLKAETKCKRRGTLSICGLGMLDETEIESIQRERISPTAGALSALPIARQEILMATATQVRELLANDRAWDAYALWQNSNFDTDEQVAFWSQFDSKQRGVLSRMRDEERAKERGTISPQQKKRLEVMIKELGVPRERVKDYCLEVFQVEHFTDLDREQYEQLCNELPNFNSKEAATQSATAAPIPVTEASVLPSAEASGALAAADPYITPDQQIAISDKCRKLGPDVLARLLLRARIDHIAKMPASKYESCKLFIASLAKAKDERKD